MKDGFLHRYCLNNATKDLYKWTHYFDIYERHFDRYRKKSPVVLELGVASGGSLKMWKEYFGPGCKIIGVDIDPSCKYHEEEDVEIFIGSQDDPNVINSIFDKYPNIDIIIDDGSHIMHHQIASFELMYERVSQTGIYLVEDTHTSYWDSHNGGLNKDGSFMVFAKHKLDEINAAHTHGAMKVTKFTTSTDYIACYDSVIVFERKPQCVKQTTWTGPMKV